MDKQLLYLGNRQNGMNCVNRNMIWLEPAEWRWNSRLTYRGSPKGVCELAHLLSD
jgi:hypothetical protein